MLDPANPTLGDIYARLGEVLTALALLGAPMAPATYDDGSAGALAGPAEHAHLLDLDPATNEAWITIKARPPWRVAGVDFPVAVLPKLKVIGVDPLPPCAAISGFTVRPTSPGCNMVFDGYLFAGGYYVYAPAEFTGAVTFKNSRCVEANASPCIYYEYNRGSNGGLLTIQNSDFDGGRLAGTNGYMVLTPPGGALIEYSRFRNGGADYIKFTSKMGVTKAVVQYNLFEDLGWEQGAHADILTFSPGDGVAGLPALSDISGVIARGNTCIQSAANAQGFPVTLNSFVNFEDMGGRSVLAPKIDHNTCVFIGATGHISTDGAKTYPAAINFVQIAPDAGMKPYGTVSDALVSDNYVWTSAGGAFNGGTKAGFYSVPFYPRSGATPNNVYQRNIQMRDGSALTDRP